MNTDGDETATSEALATLKSIEDMERSVLKYTRPSVSVILAVSLLIGLQALLVTRVDGPTQSGDGFDLLLVLTTLLVVGLVGRFFYKLRKFGIAPKMIPSSASGKSLLIGFCVFVFVVIIAAMSLADGGYSWAPYAAAVANFMATYFCMYKFPNGEWIPGERSE